MKFLLTSLLSLLTFYCTAQCPEFYDFEGTLSSTPSWISCDGNDFVLSLQSNSSIGNYSIDWGDGSAITTGSSWNANTPINHNYLSTVQDYTVTIVLNDVPCAVNGTVIMEEPTNASIQIPFGGLTSTCAPGSLEFINSSTDVSENTTFIWSFFDGTNNETYDFNNVNQLITHLYEPNTVNCATQVTLTAENECNTLQGGPSLATFTPIRIWDIDEASINPSSSLLCYPDTTVSFQNTTERNCLAQGNVSQRYEYWNLGDYWGLGYDSIIDWRPWPPAISVNVGFPGIGSYEVMMIDSSFCGLDSATQIINIVNQPVAGLSANKDTICVGESVTFENLTTGFASSFIWVFGDGSSWTQVWNGNVTRTFNSPGYFEVLLIPQITNSCRDTASVFIYVSDTPEADFIVDNNSGCDTLIVDISNNSSFDVIDWNWNFGNGNTSTASNPTTQHYSVGTYTINLDVVNSSGCSNNYSEQINVYESPQPYFEPTEVCVNEWSNFIDLSQSNEAIIAWDWDFGNGNTSNLQNPIFNFGTAGTFDVVLTVSTANCQRSDTLDVLVDSLPESNFYVSDSIGCSPMNISFSNQSSSNVVGFNWLFGDGDTSNVENSSHVFQNSWSTDTTYNTKLVVTTLAGCKDTSSFDITVLSKPIAAFNDNAVLDCAPLDVIFNNTSLNASTYEWNFGDNSTLETSFNTNHVFQNTNLTIETFEVSLIASNPNGCVDTTSKTILVYPEPQFSFSTVPASGCSPLEVNFPSVNGAVIYSWNFGDGSTSNSSNPTHVYENPSSNSIQYQVELVATSPFGCTDTTQEIITIFPQPIANFQLSDSLSCSPLSIQITNNSINATTSVWDMSSGSTFINNSSTFNYDFTNTESYIENYTINLTASNAFNCTDSLNKTVSVFPTITADFTSDTLGCSPFDVNFINTSIGANQFDWNFGDGTNSISTNNESHLYVNTSNDIQTNTVVLKATSPFGCLDSIQKDITVLPLPISQFSSPSNEGCSPFEVIFNNTSEQSQTFEWLIENENQTFNDTQLSYTFENTSNQTQNYTVSLIAIHSEGCTDTSSLSLNVYPNVNANYVVDTSGCSPLTVQFYNLSIGGNTYLWDFGDGTYTNALTPTEKTYLNTVNGEEVFNTSLIVTSNYNCSDTVSQNIHVYQSPIVNFEATPTTQFLPSSTVEFQNNSSFGTWDYEWEFGNNSSSTLQNPPPHVYGTSGDFLIKLFLSNAYGCSDSAAQWISIFPLSPQADFNGEGKGCAPLTIQFENESVEASQYSWDFGDGTYSGIENPLKTYHNHGLYSVSLTAFSPEGNHSITKEEIIEVYETPTALFFVTTEYLDVPGIILETNNQSSFATTYQWDFGDSTTTTEQNPTHNYQENGNYTISLIARNGICTDTAYRSISVTNKTSGNIIIPNSFTPNENNPNNGDFQQNNEINDIFYPVILGAKNYELDIYNRWGENLFSTKDQSIGWNGYFKNQLCETGVYIYKIKVVFLNGEEQKIIGQVTLVR